MVVAAVAVAVVLTVTGLSSSPQQVEWWPLQPQFLVRPVGLAAAQCFGVLLCSLALCGGRLKKQWVQVQSCTGPGGPWCSD